LGRHFGDGKRTAGAQQRRGQCGMSRAEVVSWRGQVEEAMEDSSSSSYPDHCRDTYIPQLDGRYRTLLCRMRRATSILGVRLSQNWRSDRKFLNASLY
jgi:hypothetical protein